MRRLNVLLRKFEERRASETIEAPTRVSRDLEDYIGKLHARYDRVIGELQSRYDHLAGVPAAQRNSGTGA